VSTKHPAFVVAVGVATILTSLVVASTAVARVAYNTIDPIATLTDKGRHLVVTGPIGCTVGERVYIRLTVTQRISGASAEGITLLACDGEGSRQQWMIDAAVFGAERFQSGPATAVASARTVTRGKTTDAHQWLVAISLVEE